MILKKPYAFLIRRFKLLHALLTILLIYIVYKNSLVLNFFNDYVKYNTYTDEINLVSKYINLSIFISIILVLLFVIIIYLLMHYKKKPKLLYLNIMVGYIGVFIIFIITYNNMSKLGLESLDARTIRFVRDMLFISSIYQYIVISLILIRAIGFDIKKFNFKQDLEELNIDVLDDEEFELTVGVDTDRIIKKTRRKTREFKYFILENKFIFIYLSILIIGIISFILFLNFQIYNKKHKENVSFKTSSVVMKVNNSYITKKDYHYNNNIEKGKSFVVVNINMNNTRIIDQTVNLKNFSLQIVDKYYYPIINQCEDFFDIGKCYKEEVLKTRQSGNYLLIFKINDVYQDEKMTFRYLNKIKYKSSGMETKSKIVKLSPIKVDKNKIIENITLSKTLNFNKSILGNTTLKINNYEIADQFSENYRSCINNNCFDKNEVIKPSGMSNYQKTILKLDLEINLDKNKNLENIKNNYDFISKFGYIRYMISNKNKFHPISLINKTPNNYNGNNLYIEVVDEIKNGRNIQLVFYIRGKEYIYNLKKD